MDSAASSFVFGFKSPNDCLLIVVVLGMLLARFSVWSVGFVSVLIFSGVVVYVLILVGLPLLLLD